MSAVCLLVGVLGQAGNTQETCSRNPAFSRLNVHQLQESFFFLKQHMKKKKNWDYLQGATLFGGCQSKVEK